MSRTRHHRGQRRQKAGKDLWSRRPCSGMAQDSKNKKICRKIERSRKVAETQRHWRESE